MITVIETDSHKIEVVGTIAGPAPVRIITVGSFKRRFGADVRKLIRESAIDAIIDMREDMDLALYVDLDDLYTVAGVNGLGPNGLGWLDNQGMADMLKDGTDREKYNGVL